MAQVKVSLAYINQQIQQVRADLAQLRVPGGVHGQAFLTEFDKVKKIIFLCNRSCFMSVCLL